MRWYRLAWISVAATLAVLGILAGGAASPASAMLAFTFFAVSAAIAVLAASQTDGPRVHSRTFRHALIGAGIAGSSAAAVLGLSTIAGPSTALVVAFALTATSPRTINTLRRWSGAVRPSGDQLDAVMHALACSSPGFVPFQRVPTELPATDERLCRAWCASFVALASTYAGGKFIRIVEDRREYLDELDRRNPAGFSAWLASGPTACDNPLPYVSLGHVEPAPINWDDLLEGHG
jgi:hypothetical protein